MSGYHSPQVDVPIRLNTNESPFPPPEQWVQQLGKIAADIDWNRYPDRGAVALREEIAKKHGVSVEQVFVANGSNEVLQTILLAYGGHGRTVATFEPTYQMYAQIAKVTGAEVVSGERRSDMTLDPLEIKRVVDAHSPAVTFLCNPNNPTGLVEPQENLEALLKIATGIVVVDEAYAEFSEWSAMGMVQEDRPLIVTRTFSKTLSMAALRVGYVVAPTWVIADLNIAVLPYHLDSFKQQATLAALAFTDEMNHRVSVIKEQRSLIEVSLSGLDIEVWSSGSNFILFRPRGVAAKVVWQALLDAGILIRDFSTTPRLEGCLRVTIGTVAENAAFLDAMSSIMGA